MMLQHHDEDLSDDLSSDAADVKAALESGLLSKEIAEVNTFSWP